MSFPFSDFAILNIMSAPPITQRAVAIKGPRKREHSSDSDPSSDSFHGCRDSPSPTLRGSVQRAIKSRKQFHRVIIETPPMHRHTLESHLEDLWKATGAEFKFVRSSFGNLTWASVKVSRLAGNGHLRPLLGVSPVTWSKCQSQAHQLLGRRISASLLRRTQAIRLKMSLVPHQVPLVSFLSSLFDGESKAFVLILGFVF